MKTIMIILMAFLFLKCPGNSNVQVMKDGEGRDPEGAGPAGAPNPIERVMIEQELKITFQVVP